MTAPMLQYRIEMKIYGGSVLQDIIKLVGLVQAINFFVIFTLHVLYNYYLQYPYYKIRV